MLSQQKYLKLGLVFLYITELGKWHIHHQIQLLIFHTVLILITTLFEGLATFVPEDNTIQWARRCNIIQGISYSTTAATSVLATFIVAAKIHRSNMNNRARRRYRHIIEITIQSSALYTFSTLGNAVITLVDKGNPNLDGSSLVNAEAYLTAFTLISTVS